MTTENLVGVRIVDARSGETLAEYRLIGGRAVAVSGGDRFICVLPEMGVWLTGPYMLIAREIGRKLGIDMDREAPYTPEDGAKYLVAFMAERTNHKGTRSEPIIEEE